MSLTAYDIIQFRKGSFVHIKLVTSVLIRLAAFICRKSSAIDETDELVSAICVDILAGKVEPYLDSASSNIEPLLIKWLQFKLWNSQHYYKRCLLIEPTQLDLYRDEQLEIDNQIDLDRDKLICNMQSKLDFLKKKLEDGSCGKKKAKPQLSDAKKIDHKNIYFLEEKRNLLGYSVKQWSKLLTIPYERYRSYTLLRATPPPELVKQVEHRVAQEAARIKDANYLRTMTSQVYARYLLSIYGGDELGLCIEIGIHTKTFNRWQQGQTLPLWKKLEYYHAII